MGLRTLPVFFFAALAASLASSAQAADRKPPRIRHRAVTQAQSGHTLQIRVKISDPSGVFDPTLYYRNVGSKDYLRATLVEDKKQFVATIPANVVQKDIEYFVEAYDEMGNGPARVGKPSRPLRIRVMMAASAADLPPSVSDPGTAEDASTNTTTGSGRTRLGGTTTTGGTDQSDASVDVANTVDSSGSTTLVSTGPSGTAPNDSIGGGGVSTSSGNTGTIPKSGTLAESSTDTGSEPAVDEEDDGSLLAIIAASTGGVLVLVGAGSAALAYLVLNQPPPSIVTLKVSAPPPVTQLRGAP